MMTKLRAFIYFITLISFVSLFGGVITLQGYNQGKNIKVQNTDGSINELCTIAVYVNGKKVMDAPESPIYEIDLSSFELGERVVIKIQHKGDCKPRVLNQQAIKPNSRFVFGDIIIKEEGLKWTTRGEERKGKMLVQQLTRFVDENKWIDIGTIPTKGNLSFNQYYLNVRHYSGLNKYRIKYIEEGTGLSFYSDSYEYISTKKIVSMYPKKVSNRINFTTRQPVPYRIYDSDGALVMEGVGIFVNCTSLPANEYYTVIFDNHKERFLKKKNK